MATDSIGDLTVTSSWQDVVATYPSAANVDVRIQNLDNDPVYVVFGGNDAPTTKSGTILDTYDSTAGSAAHIWVRGSGGISVTLS